MKIDKMIKELQAVKDKYGNIEVVMASDSEGNSYSTIDENFRYSRVYDNEKDFINAMSNGIVSGPAKEAIDGFYKNAPVIVICIFPLIENMQFAEEACKYAEKETEIS